MVYHIYPDVGVTLTVTWQDEADKSASDGTPRPFSISGPSEVLALLDEFANEPRSDEELDHCGVLAPPTEVTLAGAQREAAGIPLEAAFFAFAYPLPSLTNRFEELVVEQGRCEPWLFFLLLGGYCYFDAQRRLIRTNALMLTPAAARLEMVGPFRPSVSALQRLREAHRLQPCTLQTLVAAGYRAFAWVNPGEVPGGGPTILADGSQLEGGGCFVYEMQVKTGGGSSPHDRLMMASLMASLMTSLIASLMASLMTSLMTSLMATWVPLANLMASACGWQDGATSLYTLVPQKPPTMLASLFAKVFSAGVQHAHERDVAEGGIDGEPPAKLAESMG